MLNITVAGTGYVGYSLSVLLSKVAKVTCYDINENKIELINSNKSPIIDNDIFVTIKQISSGQRSLFPQHIFS